MSITKEQVADLQPGDVVELTGYPVLKGATLHGPIRAFDGKGLAVGPVIVRHRDGTPATQYEDDDDFTLTVISRAPRPLYVNHPRTEAVPGDVAADWEAPNDYEPLILLRTAGQRFPAKWIDQFGMERTYNSPARLRLLVDGSTGQAVQ